MSTKNSGPPGSGRHKPVSPRLDCSRRGQHRKMNRTATKTVTGSIPYTRKCASEKVLALRSGRWLTPHSAKKRLSCPCAKPEVETCSMTAQQFCFFFAHADGKSHAASLVALHAQGRASLRLEIFGSDGLSARYLRFFPFDLRFFFQLWQRLVLRRPGIEYLPVDWSGSMRCRGRWTTSHGNSSTSHRCCHFLHAFV